MSPPPAPLSVSDAFKTFYDHTPFSAGEEWLLKSWQEGDTEVKACLVIATCMDSHFMATLGPLRVGYLRDVATSDALSRQIAQVISNWPKVEYSHEDTAAIDELILSAGELNLPTSELQSLKSRIEMSLEPKT